MTELKLGAATVQRIEESYEPNFEAKSFFPDWQPSVVSQHRSWMVPDHYDEASGFLKLSVHSWLITIGGKRILIDTCVGNHKSRPARPKWHLMETPYLARLKAAGVDPDQVDMVMCTHLHVDHVGWNTRLDNGKWVPTFPNARYVMSRTDHDFWKEEAARPGTEAFKVNTYNDSVLPIVEARKAEFVTGEHAMCGCMTIRPTPGHTPGQIRFDLESRGKRAIFAGDALHNPVQVPLWRWNSVFCEDREQARLTRHKLLADCVEQGALLMPAHFAPPHAAYIRANGERFELDWDHDNARGR